MTTSEMTEKWRELEMEPLGNRVYILLDNVPEKAGRIVLTGDQATPSRIGTILKVGRDVNLPTQVGGPYPPPLLMGDRVLIGCHSGVNLYLWQYGMTNENWKMCTRSEIMAKITKETEAPKEG